MKKTILSILLMGSPALACIEVPKALSLSETTYEKDVEISYGVNCRVGVTLSAKSGVNYYLRTEARDRGSVEETLCLVVSKEKETDPKKASHTYCGKELAQLAKTNKEELTLRDKSGKAVGFLNITEKSMQILSWDAGGTKNKPYLEFLIDDPEKKWTLNAMQKEGEQVGGGILESTGCTRGLDIGRSSDQTVDLRGKSISTSDGGCHSGLNVSDYSGASKTRVKKAVLKMETGQSD